MGTHRWILSSSFFSRTSLAMASRTLRSLTTTSLPFLLNLPPPTFFAAIPPISGCKSDDARILRIPRTSWSLVGILPALSAP